MTTTTITANGRRGMTERNVYHDITELVSVLRQKELSVKEMTAIQNKHEVKKKWSYKNMEQLLEYIGGQYPVYESNFRKYKILTEEDIEKYREELRKNGK